MCEATTLMLISAGVSAYGQYQQAQAQADAMDSQAAVDRRNAEIRNQQLEEEAAIERIRAHDEEMERRKRLNESLSTMRAMNRGRESGSYLAMANADREAYKFDVSQIRLGAGIGQSRIASQIAINKTSVSNAGYGSDAVRKGGMFSAGSTLIGAGATYQETKVPSSTTTSSTYKSAYSGSPNPFGATKPANYT